MAKMNNADTNNNEFPPLPLILTSTDHLPLIQDGQTKEFAWTVVGGKTKI